MKFKNEDEFMMHCFTKSEKVEVNAIELQGRLIEINAQSREITKLNRKILDLTLKNEFLSARLEEEKMKKKSVYSLDLSA